MRLQNLLLITWKETRDLLRDRRTLVLLFIAPMILYPLFGLTGWLFATELITSIRELTQRGLEVWIAGRPGPNEAALREAGARVGVSQRGGPSLVRVHRQPRSDGGLCRDGHGPS